MNDVWVLRDHRYPCGHTTGERDHIEGLTVWSGGAYRYDDGLWQCDESGCPGGREVRLRQMWVCVYGRGRQVCTKYQPHPTGSTAHRCREVLVEVTDE